MTFLSPIEWCFCSMRRLNKSNTRCSSNIWNLMHNCVIEQIGHYIGILGNHSNCINIIRNTFLLLLIGFRYVYKSHLIKSFKSTSDWIKFFVIYIFHQMNDYILKKIILHPLVDFTVWSAAMYTRSPGDNAQGVSADYSQ